MSFRAHSMPRSGPEERSKLPRWIADQQGVLVVIAIAFAIAISASWLTFPYLVEGQRVLSDVGGEVKQEKLAKSIGIGKFLTRSTFGPGEAQVDVLYATPKYFELTDRADAVSEYRPDQYLVFFVTESTHIDELPAQLPDAVLRIGEKEYQSLEIEGPLDIYHHRTVTVRFPAFDASGDPITRHGDRLELALSNGWDAADTVRHFSWDLPVEYPENLRSNTPWTPFTVLGLSAGLLSFVLTPCLLQLLVVYVLTLTGYTAQQLQTGNARIPADVSKKMFLMAVWFVTGFAALFTVTGALIGLAGKEVQMFFSIWSRDISIAAGLVIVLMGIWIGIRSRAPLVCNMVPSRLRSKFAGPGSNLGAAVIAIGFSLGCITCFGGAIIATLLIYVGSLGSAWIGALVMFAFSMGVVVPFLLAALFLSRVLPLLTRINQFAPYLGFASMLVLVAFGLVLVTDNFHALSDFIYPYLGL